MKEQEQSRLCPLKYLSLENQNETDNQKKPVEPHIKFIHCTLMLIVNKMEQVLFTIFQCCSRSSNVSLFLTLKNSCWEGQ